ncbi:MAG: twin-arginine translocation signal domain-containing protein [Armatimonadota bacterium]|nr:twin-arginine translocation signal domain-containing protein [Armatimonadota bacterium]
MDISRREFMKTALQGVAVGVSVLATDTAFAEQANTQPAKTAAGPSSTTGNTPGDTPANLPNPQQLQQATYEKLINTAFVIAPLKTPLPAPPPKRRRISRSRWEEPGKGPASVIAMPQAKPGSTQAMLNTATTPPNPAPVRVVLTEVTDHAADLRKRGHRLSPKPQPAPQGESFTLVFLGPAEPSLPQDTYTITHPQLGEFILFLSAGGKHKKGRY